MNILNLGKEIFLGIVDLIYPRTCAACAKETPVDNGIFCIQCLASLSFSESHLFVENEFTNQFIGRVPIKFGAAMLYLVPGGLTQHLIHEIKYKDRKDFALEIGEWYGTKLLTCPFLPAFDKIIPVPLHPKRLHQRGYNQSGYFGLGLSHSMGIKLDQTSLTRKVHTDSQTRKSRLNRLDNMMNAFSVKKPFQIRGKKILLIDDVLTTGATLEACANQLLEYGAAEISMVTIAMGRI